jgi:hypothetical protein
MDDQQRKAYACQILQSRRFPCQTVGVEVEISMFPTWFTKPESLFGLALFFLSPLWYWLAKTAVSHINSWHASRSESAARVSLAYLHKALDNPPTLLESVAYIVCFLPIPIFVVATGFTLYFLPQLHWHSPLALAPDVANEIRRTIGLVLSLFCYTIFGVLMVHGINTAYHLRQGQALYHANYRAGIQKRIDKLLKKFPPLRSLPVASRTSLDDSH